MMTVQFHYYNRKCGMAHLPDSSHCPARSGQCQTQPCREKTFLVDQARCWLLANLNLENFCAEQNLSEVHSLIPKLQVHHNDAVKSGSNWSAVKHRIVI